MNDDENKSTSLATNYSGKCAEENFSTTELIQLTNPDRSMIHGSTLFAVKYRVLPCTTRENLQITPGVYDDLFAMNAFGQISPQFGRMRRPGDRRKQGGMLHATSVMKFLKDEHHVDPNTFLYDMDYDTHEKKSLMTTVYIDLGNYLSIILTNGFISPTNVDNPNNLEADHEDKSFNCFSNMNVFHTPQTATRAQTLLQNVSKFKVYPVVEATLRMVCHNAQRGFYTSMIRMKKPHISDLKLHYGDDFPELHEDLLETLQEKDSTGITFLHGLPGTGKTYYLRYLINEIKDKSLIYVPPDLVNDMTKPGFLPFLMQHPNSILIVEDAENIIRDRKQDTFLPNQAVANLLNLSDGLLGDAMHQQIICTFNCDVSGIDPALLREGRLVIEHKFDKLNVENARRLCAELEIPGQGADVREAMSLAEIYARKNAAPPNASNADDDGQTNSRTRRQWRRKRAQPDSHFSLYS